jgi:hypothetical protein
MLKVHEEGWNYFGFADVTVSAIRIKTLSIAGSENVASVRDLTFYNRITADILQPNHRGYSTTESPRILNAR